MTKQYQEVSKLRVEIDHLRDEIEWVTTGFVPPDELKARATKHCQAMAQEFNAARRLMSLAHPQSGGEEMKAMFRASSNVFVGGIPMACVNIDEIGPMLAWSLGDALSQRMCAEIDCLDYRPGPPTAERPARLIDLKAALKKLEQQEEKVICDAEKGGIIIPRRHDANPAVILNYDPDSKMSEDRRRISGTSVTVS
ncbi:MAG: hypothetical protein Q7U78_03070 [Gallionella sp.]|nr:hypothetical protein [Gallionella sp.]